MNRNLNDKRCKTSFILKAQFTIIIIESNRHGNKNAFQWDEYRPLVDHIPASIAQGGVCPEVMPAQRGSVSQHAMGQTPPVDRQTPVKT